MQDNQDKLKEDFLNHLYSYCEIQTFLDLNLYQRKAVEMAKMIKSPNTVTGAGDCPFLAVLRWTPMMDDPPMDQNLRKHLVDAMLPNYKGPMQSGRVQKTGEIKYTGIHLFEYLSKIRSNTDICDYFCDQRDLFSNICREWINDPKTKFKTQQSDKSRIFLNFESNFSDQEIVQFTNKGGNFFWLEGMKGKDFASKVNKNLDSFDASRFQQLLDLGLNAHGFTYDAYIDKIGFGQATSLAYAAIDLNSPLFGELLKSGADTERTHFKSKDGLELNILEILSKLKSLQPENSAVYDTMEASFKTFVAAKEARSVVDSLRGEFRSGLHL